MLSWSSLGRTALLHVRASGCPQAWAACVLSRCGHSSANNRTHGARQRELSRGQEGPQARVTGPAEGRELRQKLVEARTGSEVLTLLTVDQVGSESLGYAEYGKAFQRCGEMRDLIALLQVWEVVRESGVKLSGVAYSILITAAARASRGMHGIADEEVKLRAFETGKSAWLWMRYEGHEPSLGHYGAALGLCAKVGNADWAQELWTEMIQHDFQPTSIELCQYLEALASHGGNSEWELVKSELIAAETRLIKHDATTLCALLNSAARHKSLDRVDWLQQHLLPRVEVNAIVYCSLSKALLLCQQPERALPLISDMQARGATPLFRSFLQEAQALVLIFWKSPDQLHVYDKFKVTAEAASAFMDQSRNSPGAAPPMSRAEIRQLESLESLARRISTGEQVPLSQVHVIDWPWAT